MSWCAAVCFFSVFLCRLIQKSWDPTVADQCYDLGMFYYGLQVPNIATDLIILLLSLKISMGTSVGYQGSLHYCSDLLVRHIVSCGLAMITDKGRLTCSRSLAFAIIRLMTLKGLPNPDPDIPCKPT